MDCGEGVGEGGGGFIREILRFLYMLCSPYRTFVNNTEQSVACAVMYKEFSVLFRFCQCLPKYNHYSDWVCTAVMSK